MKDKDFQKFKQSIAHQRDFDFDHADWNRISEQLDQSKSTSFLSWKSIAVAIVLFLFSGNLFLWSELSKNQSQNQALLTQLLQKHKTDTVIIERVNTISDTIYKEKENRVISKTFSSTIPYFSHHGPWFSYFDQTHSDEKVDSAALQNDLKASVKHSIYRIENGLSTLFNTVNFDRQNPNLTVKTSQLFSLNTGPSTFQHIAYYLRPKGIFVGGDLATNFSFLESYKRQENSGIGLRIEIPFSPKVSLWTLFSVHFTEFSSDFILKDFEKDQIEIPSHIEFKELSIIQKYKQLMFGFKYDFLKRKKWKPFMTVGFGVVRKLQTSVIYDFVDKTNGLPIRVHKKRLVDDFEIKNLLEVGIGINYQYNNRLHFQSKLGYMLVGNQQNVFYKSSVNLGVGILYHFNL